MLEFTATAMQVELFWEGIFATAVTEYNIRETKLWNFVTLLFSRVVYAPVLIWLAVR